MATKTLLDRQTALSSGEYTTQIGVARQYGLTVYEHTIKDGRVLLTAPQVSYAFKKLNIQPVINGTSKGPSLYLRSDIDGFTKEDLLDAASNASRDNKRTRESSNKRSTLKSFSIRSTNSENKESVTEFQMGQISLYQKRNNYDINAFQGIAMLVGHSSGLWRHVNQWLSIGIKTRDMDIVDRDGEVCEALFKEASRLKLDISIATSDLYSHVIRNTLKYSKPYFCVDGDANNSFYSNYQGIKRIIDGVEHALLPQFIISTYCLRKQEDIFWEHASRLFFNKDSKLENIIPALFRDSNVYKHYNDVCPYYSYDGANSVPMATNMFIKKREAL